MPRRGARTRARRQVAAQAAEAAGQREASGAAAQARSTTNRNVPTNPEALQQTRDPFEGREQWLQQIVALGNPFEDLPDSDGYLLFEFEAPQEHQWTGTAAEALSTTNRNPPIEPEAPQQTRDPFEGRDQWLQQIVALGIPFEDLPDSDGSPIFDFEAVQASPWIPQADQGQPWIPQPGIQQQGAMGNPRMQQPASNGLRWIRQPGLQQGRAPGNPLIQHPADQGQLGTQALPQIQQPAVHRQPVPRAPATITGTYIRMPDTPNQEALMIFTVDV